MTWEERLIERQVTHLRAHLAHHHLSADALSLQLFGEILTLEELSGRQRYDMEAHLLARQQQTDRRSQRLFERLSRDEQAQVLEDFLR